MKYSIDTSALIDLWKLPKDIFKSLWSDFDDLCKQNDILASDVVVGDLDIREGDELCKWCKMRQSLNIPLDESLQSAVMEVTSRCDLVDYENHRSEADPFVVALAFLHDLAVISSEKPRKNKTARMKIPDACTEMGVQHLRLYDFIRAEGWSY